MDFKSVLSKITDVENAPTTRDMTKAQFGEYVTDQISKAEKDKKEGKGETAKKRLVHLRAAVEGVAKADVWSGDNGTAAIPIYNEPDITNASELTETEVNITSAQSGAANGDNISAAGGAPAEFGKALDAIKKNVDAFGVVTNAVTSATAPAGGGTPEFAWPSDISSPEFMKEGVHKRDGGEWGFDEKK